ncbi:hypothetical protein JAB1_31900 [Janthinobacterium sp. MP5059B]|uniref:DUF4123 domain-containing protein n=1 Tax=Janthinobacterium TaxID=29580 RepID=UPI000893CED7|nr:MULTISPECIES: DUF4123 domain-containing protein [Janthinobacterium]OEZ48580.1 hypothetical protein JAB1_31900 [Janthinobacterium sp. MP5059B]
MTAPIDVVARLAQLQQSTPALRLYALVDGAQYRTQIGTSLTTREGCHSLFAGTPDAALAHAGPWLVDAEQASDALFDALVSLEHAAPAVTWLIAPQTITGLAQLLQLNLDTALPDGRTALLRFWDPRVLISLAELLEPGQREVFFGHIHEWHLLHQGQRTWIGRQHAQAQ